MRYGPARLQEQGASDSDRYRQHHSAATPQIPDAPVQNRMCGSLYMYDQTGGVASTVYAAAIQWFQPWAALRQHADGGKPGVGTYADTVWCAQHEPTVPSSSLQR